MTYIVIGICLVLLIAVVYISAKPISMGIEARRNINHGSSEESEELLEKNEKIDFEKDYLKNTNITDEISRLNQLKIDGVLSEEEFKRAKKKIIRLSRFNFFLYKFRHFIVFFDYILFFSFWLEYNH